MQMYGGGFLFYGRAGDCYSWENVENGCSIPRANFDNFGVAMVTIFQMMTGEDWNMVMYDGIASTNNLAFFYFAIIVVIGNFLILNLFLTILLSGFEEDEVDPEEEKAQIRDKLFALFKNLDVDNSSTVSFAELKNGLMVLKIKSEEEIITLFDGKKEISFNEFVAGFPEYAEAEVEPEEPSFLRKLLCCFKVTPTNEQTEDAVIEGPGGPIVDDESTIPNHTAFFCLARTNVLRIHAFKFIQWSVFENVVLFCIILSSLALAYQNPTSHGGPHASEPTAQALYIADLIFLAIFTVEMLFKHIALGVVGHPRAYWRDPWNAMDGFIVVMAYVGLLASDLPQLKPLRAIRTMRALRPLRALKMFPGMKIAVNCLLRSIPLMLPIGMVSFLFFFVFAILGLQLYAGKLWYCDTSGADAAGAFALVSSLVANAGNTHDATLWPTANDILAPSIFFVKSVDEGLGFEDVTTSADVVDAFPYLANEAMWDQATALVAPATCAATTGAVPACAAANADQTTCEAAGACTFTAQLFNSYYTDDGSLYQWEATNVLGTPAGKAKLNEGFDTFCMDPNSFHGTECTRAECRLVGGTWVNQMTHFDNVAEALLCLFEMSTTEGWPTVMWNAMDAGEVGVQPYFEQSFSNVAFFVIFLIVGNFFVLNLFVGSVIDNYLTLEKEAKEEKLNLGGDYHAGDQFLTDSQAEWAKKQRAEYERTMQAEAAGKGVEPQRSAPSNGFRGVFFKIVENGWFDALITLFILINIIIMSMKHRDMSPFFEDTFMWGANWFFTVAFVLEAVFKLIAWFPKEYFTGEGSGWNQFDFFLVAVSIASKIFDFGSFATIFRVFRVLRVIKLIKRAKELKRLMQTILISLPALGNVGSLLLLVFFIYAILGVNFFYAACGVTPYFTTDVGSSGVLPSGELLTMSSDMAPATPLEFTFDPCSDVDHGYGFDGFVSTNFKHNVALWAAHATDADSDGVVTKVELLAVAAALVKPEGGASFTVVEAGTHWDAAAGAAVASLTIDSAATAAGAASRLKLLAVFGTTAFTEKGSLNDVGFHDWAAGGEYPHTKADSEKVKVGAVSYVEKSAYMKANRETDAECATAADKQVCYNTDAGVDDLRWIYDPTLKADKANRLWCTELTLKTSEYTEVKQTILDGQDDAPAYSDPSCDNIGYDANFSSFSRAFITLIR